MPFDSVVISYFNDRVLAIRDLCDNVSHIVNAKIFFADFILPSLLASAFISIVI